VASDCRIPVSAAGNNMMISAQAYRDTGGYENIPFSVTEDHALFIAALKKGWDYKNTMYYDCLAETKPMASFGKLLKQRKRWMQGAVKVPLVLVFFLFLQSIFLPMVLWGLFYFPVLTLVVWGLKILLQQFFIVSSFQRIRKSYQFWKGAFLYEFYSGILSPLVLLYHLIPTKVEWKGRQY
jgi:cellulose synthase/poly-beta-1,6-N-acetylglucosamine synthase-like glycosyltransferase